MIDPQDIIRKYSPEEICEGAENYFAANPDPSLHIQKPLRTFAEARLISEKLGALLRGIDLAPRMRVLDFGAGTCWLSNMLQQMGAKVTSLDPSPTALEIGKQVVAANPFIEEDEATYQIFNGRTIDAPDNFFDRIICFDVFHHIPNWEDILIEMARVLKPGGIIGFSEPGHDHSQSQTSQAEMRNYVVLENDIHLPKIIEAAEGANLKFMGWEPYIEGVMKRKEYHATLNAHPWSLSALHVKKKLFRNLRKMLRGTAIFYLSKGNPQLDSRMGKRLSAEIETDLARYALNESETVSIKLSITNIGSALWLQDAEEGYGKVYIGAHLHHESGDLIQPDWVRCEIPKDIAPDESFETSLKGHPLEPGSYTLHIDLVSEGVCWFENSVSATHFPKKVSLQVTKESSQ